MSTGKPIASLSLDLDNKWSYMKTHGDAGWESYPSYLDVVVPRFLDFFRERNQLITVFIVGQDAALEKNHDAIASIADEGHEIGNHSFKHEPWLHLYSPDDLEADLGAAEEHIERVTGQVPIGFRGPGFSSSPAVVRRLAEAGYWYDASTFPTFLGPLARAYYFFTASLDDQQKDERKVLFGKFSEGFRFNGPSVIDVDDKELVEIPVTTMPIFKIPIHVSYVLYLAGYSRALAKLYWRIALTMCRVTGTHPSLLLHPLDFMGCDDDSDLAFFPAMGMPSAKKIEIVGEIIDTMSKHYDLVPMKEHARYAGRRLDVRLPTEDTRLRIPAVTAERSLAQL